MILSIHGIAGAVLSSFGANPIEASAMGLTSHYFMDSLPHFDYKVDNIMKGDLKSASLEFLKISADLAVLSAIVFFIIQKNPKNVLSILFGTFFALLPDGLLFIHYISNKYISNSFIGKLLLNHYKFHYNVHSKIYSVNVVSAAVQLLLIIFLTAAIFR